jgi:hypothetical protein
LGALETDFSFKRINVRVPQNPINTPKYFLLVIFSLIMITEIRKIKIGARVVMIALFIGVELYKPFNAVIIFKPIPKIEHIIISLKSLISTFSFFTNNDIIQKQTAAPRTLQYNSALGDNMFGMSSLAIV